MENNRIELLIIRLNSRNPKVRYKAAKALGQLKDKQAVLPLITSLKDNSPKVRRCAAQALGHIKDGQAVEPLIIALKDADERVRYESIVALGQLGDTRAIEPLLNHLNNYGVRKTVFEALSKMGEPGILIFTQLLLDATPWCDTASVLLSRMGERGISSLIETLRNTNRKVRWSAAWAMGQLGFRESRAVQPLIPLLEDEDIGVRQVVIGALGAIGDETAFEPLIDVLKGKEHFSKLTIPAYNVYIFSQAEDKSKAVNGFIRSETARALGNLGDLRAVGPLIDALNDYYAKGAAVEALAKLGALQAIEPIIRYFKNGVLRYASVATILGNFGDRQAVEPLIEALKSKDESLRFYAAKALGKLGDPKALPALELMLQNDTGYNGGGRENKAAAAFAIQKIREKQ